MPIERVTDIKFLGVLIDCNLLLSHISYAITCWGFNKCTRMSELQNNVIRFVTNSKSNSHTEPLYWRLVL